MVHSSNDSMEDASLEYFSIQMGREEEPRW
jgi:hypothetical protein